MKPDNKNAIDNMISLIEQTKGMVPAFFEAVRWSDAKHVKRLLGEGVDPNSSLPPDDVTPLMLASNASITGLLIRSGAEVNAVDKNGRTALFHFLSLIYPKRAALSHVKEIIAHGADTQLGPWGDSSAYKLAYAKYGDDVARLLDGGGD